MKRPSVQGCIHSVFQAVVPSGKRASGTVSTVNSNCPGLRCASSGLRFRPRDGNGPRFSCRSRCTTQVSLSVGTTAWNRAFHGWRALAPAVRAFPPSMAVKRPSVQGRIHSVFQAVVPSGKRASGTFKNEPPQNHLCYNAPLSTFEPPTKPCPIQVQMPLRSRPPDCFGA